MESQGPGEFVKYHDHIFGTQEIVQIGHIVEKIKFALRQNL